jgi:hypothetical protein
MQALADGQRVPLGVASYDGLYLGGDTVWETISAPLDAKALAQLGSASRVEFRVCGSELTAPDEFFCAARELACKVQEWRSGGRNLAHCEPQPLPGPSPPKPQAGTRPPPDLPPSPRS